MTALRLEQVDVRLDPTSASEDRRLGASLASGEGRLAGPALTGIDLDVATGERLAILGPSGAGKTTLLRLFVGATVAERGSVTIDGQVLSQRSARELRTLRARIGFVHQDHRLVPNQRVLSNVLAGRLGRWSFLRGLREQVRPTRTHVHEVHRILERVGIPDKLYQRVDTLSGGEQQRVAIARALFQEPDVLLADEPVSSVDPTRARETIELLTRLADEDGTTLVVSLHDVDLARSFFPRLVGLRAGRIVFDGPTNELADDRLERLFALEPSATDDARPPRTDPSLPSGRCGQ